jgi:hypothetical protein
MRRNPQTPAGDARQHTAKALFEYPAPGLLKTGVCTSATECVTVYKSCRRSHRGPPPHRDIRLVTANRSAESGNVHPDCRCRHNKPSGSHPNLPGRPAREPLAGFISKRTSLSSDHPWYSAENPMADYPRGRRYTGIIFFWRVLWKLRINTINHADSIALRRGTAIRDRRPEWVSCFGFPLYQESFEYGIVPITYCI